MAAPPWFRDPTGTLHVAATKADEDRFAARKWKRVRASDAVREINSGKQAALQERLHKRSTAVDRATAEAEAAKRKAAQKAAARQIVANADLKIATRPLAPIPTVDGDTVAEQEKS